MAALGQAGSATQRPARSSRWAAGGALSCIQTRSLGSSMIPLSRPFSQWSHQRSASSRKPIRGPGWAKCG